MWNGTMFVDLDWPLNASSLLSASAELLVIILVTHPKSYIETTDRRDFYGKPSEWRSGVDGCHREKFRNF